jgi:hypothetical protein
MIIPRSKKETRSGESFAISSQIRVKVDKDSEFSVGIMAEMIPYISAVVSEEAGCEVSISILPEISDKNEFYKLTSISGEVNIKAKDKRGVVNAIATLSQLICEREGIYYVDEADIEDYPDKEFRSFMIDTGRKYIPIDELRAEILMMAKAKMTKLHWHITDAEGCPVLFETLSGIKSPDPDGRKYTKDELKEIVAYAGEFLIDVIPEIDMPGHSFALTEYMPNLACRAENPEGWDICIGNEDSYKYVEDIIGELTEIFPYEYYHIGTDEIDMRDVHSSLGWEIQDWDRCPVCNEKFAKLGLNTVTERFYYFLKRVHEIVASFGKKIMMWNDNIDISKSPDLPRDILIEFWRVAGKHRGPREGCSMQRFLEEGFTVVNADYPNTYIDLPEYLNWKKLREWNLTRDPAITVEHENRIIGAESCAWDVQRHYAFSLYTTVPAFADRIYNLSPITDDEKFGIALTKLALGPSVPRDFNMFDGILRDFILGYNDCDIFDEGADKESFKALLLSLKSTSPEQKKLISAYLELL